MHVIFEYFFVIDYCLENKNNDYPELLFAYLDKLINRILSILLSRFRRFSFYKNTFNMQFTTLMLLINQTNLIYMAP